MITNGPDWDMYIASTCTCGCYVSKDHYCFAGIASGLSFEEWIANDRKSKPNDYESY